MKRHEGNTSLFHEKIISEFMQILHLRGNFVAGYESLVS
jgi:hypothetical protein